MHFQSLYYCDLENEVKVKSNQFFVVSQLHIHENLVRIQLLVLKILCWQEGVTQTPKPMPNNTDANTNGICCKNYMSLSP